jgi:hypothetical protein
VPYYTHRFSLAEDVAAHRFSPAMIDDLNSQHTSRMQDMMQLNLSGTQDDPYASSVQNYMSTLSSQMSTSNTNTAQAVPTLFVRQTLSSFFKSYTDLRGTDALVSMRDNVASAGRWTTEQIDSHISKVSSYDDLYSKLPTDDRTPYLTQLNALMQETLIAKLRSQ